MTANLAWLVLLAPLTAAVLVLFLARSRPGLCAALSVGASSLAFLSSLALFVQGARGVFEVEWLAVGPLRASLGVLLDPLSLLMLLVVTGVGSAIHFYSLGYLRGDPGFGRFFGGLSLFMFSMIGIVVSPSFLQLFIFWELVGVSSYLLIGFWFERPSAADAAKKAFLTNRVGDFGFLLGMLCLWGTLHSLDFSEMQRKLASDPAALGTWGTAVGLLVFCGAVGKSAQFPLHVWLPDAMEGPTPVSALIHAATMVAAGVYMLCRLFFLLTPGALVVIAWVGGATALLAALIAVQQNDIKRILAYSTLSQLGYMVMAVGLAAPAAAMFHLTTHAFFKALLFLAAGSVIHAMHHEQDIWKMGGLKAKTPVTAATFALGTLALCGLPPFSGFFSKDQILAEAAHRSLPLFALATFVALLTAFYMFRLGIVAFLGAGRTSQAGHAHESPAVMTLPLVVLAVPSVLAGFWGIDPLLRPLWGQGAAEASGWLKVLVEPFHHSPVAASAGLLAAALGAAAAFLIYRDSATDPLPARLGVASRWLRDRFYFDELYTAIIGATQETLATVSAAVDRWIVEGLCVRGTHGTVELFGRALRLFQTGNLQTYTLLFLLGLVLLLWFGLGR